MTTEDMNGASSHCTTFESYNWKSAQLVRESLDSMTIGVTRQTKKKNHSPYLRLRQIMTIILRNRTFPSSRKGHHHCIRMRRILLRTSRFSKSLKQSTVVRRIAPSSIALTRTITITPIRTVPVFPWTI